MRIARCRTRICHCAPSAGLPVTSHPTVSYLHLQQVQALAARRVLSLTTVSPMPFLTICELSSSLLESLSGVALSSSSSNRSGIKEKHSFELEHTGIIVKSTYHELIHGQAIQEVCLGGVGVAGTADRTTSLIGIASARPEGHRSGQTP